LWRCAQQAAAASAADLAWWELFKDPVLQGLIREALKNNYDLQLAVARVEQQLALLGVSRSQYYPQIAFDTNISGQQSRIVPNHTYYSYSFASFWEIDLFGRIRNTAPRSLHGTRPKFPLRSWLRRPSAKFPRRFPHTSN
jgi:multidrug efflux system outer membrane protein